MNENNYVQYDLKGFCNLKLRENVPYKVANDQYIDTIQLNDTLTKMILYLKNGISYKNNKEYIDIFARQIIFNLIAKTEADIDNPDWHIEGIFENREMFSGEQLGFRESVTVFRCIDAVKIYENLLNSPTSMNKHFLLYERIFSVLQNPNLVVQFMSLYQILLEKTTCVIGHGKGQKNVTDYFKLNKDKYPFIEFQPSRDPRKNGRDEDRFTYIRNKIGHCEETDDFAAYKKLGSIITNQLIKKMLIVLNDVIMLLK